MAKSPDKPKKKTGRPPKFSSPEELTRLADPYFRDTPFDEWTITGLCLALETTRDILCDYEKKPEFTNAIKRLKLRVENSYEMALRKNGRAGEIFALKNMGWKDKQEIESKQDISITGLPSAIAEMITPHE